ncbi:MAG TPA: multidrug effflux MFS transporter [Stellaceae bacterium]|nr:multidrug effflux MFS transporter [Stellaceae bacterium]
MAMPSPQELAAVAGLRRPPSLALLAAVTAIGFSALHMVVPALPVLAAVFDSPPARVQLVLTLYFAGIAAGQVFYGPISDRFGRRPVLIAGLALFLVGSAVCALAWSLPALVVGRMLQAVGACAGIVLGRAIIRDVYDREGAARGIAIVMMAMTLAPALSPAVGAYLAEGVGWRAIFALLGAIGALVLVLTVARLGESNPQPVALDLFGMARSYVALLRSGAFVGFALASAFTSASWFTFIATAPYVLSQQLHEPPSTYGAMILLPMAAYMLGNAAAARFSRVVGSTRLFLFGVALSLFSGALMAVWCAAALGVWALFVPIALSSIGNGLSQPPAMAAGLSIYPRLAGTASGVIGSLQMLASALGTLFVGWLPREAALSLVAVVDLCLVLAMVFGAVAAYRSRAARREERPQPSTA